MELDGGPVSATDLGALALYNYGHFTSMRVEEMRVRGLARHLDRLERDCRTLFGVDLDRDRVRQLVRRVGARDSSPVMIRVTVFAPELEIGSPGGQAEPSILVTTRPAARHALPPIRLKSTVYSRDLPAVKHVGLFGTVHLRRRAQRDGFDDVLFVDARPRVVEGATWNIGFFDGEHVVWPESDCLPGVTEDLLKEILDAEGRSRVTAAVELADLSRMRFAFVTNAAVGVRPVRSIDDVRLPGEAALWESLRDAYASLPGELL